MCNPHLTYSAYNFTNLLKKKRRVQTNANKRACIESLTSNINQMIIRLDEEAFSISALGHRGFLILRKVPAFFLEVKLFRLHFGIRLFTFPFLRSLPSLKLQPRLRLFFLIFFHFFSPPNRPSLLPASLSNHPSRKFWDLKFTFFRHEEKLTRK